MPLYRTGLLLIRAWVETGSVKPLRAQIRTTTDVAKGLERELTVVDVPSATAKVEAWLADILAAGELALEDVDTPTRDRNSKTTWELNDLKDMPVVSNAAAKEIGRVHEVLFDPGAN